MENILGNSSFILMWFRDARSGKMTEEHLSGKFKWYTLKYFITTFQISFELSLCGFLISQWGLSAYTAYTYTQRLRLTGNSKGDVRSPLPQGWLAEGRHWSGVEELCPLTKYLTFEVGCYGLARMSVTCISVHDLTTLADFFWIVCYSIAYFKSPGSGFLNDF